VAGAKPPRTSSFLKIRVSSDMFFGENIDWWFLLRNYQKKLIGSGND
jgi:hypothetical protein